MNECLRVALIGYSVTFVVTGCYCCELTLSAVAATATECRGAESIHDIVFNARTGNAMPNVVKVWLIW